MEFVLWFLIAGGLFMAYEIMVKRNLTLTKIDVGMIKTLVSFVYCLVIVIVFLHSFRKRPSKA